LLAPDPTAPVLPRLRHRILAGCLRRTVSRSSATKCAWVAAACSAIVRAQLACWDRHHRDLVLLGARLWRNAEHGCGHSHRFKFERSPP
jgi:hypothetical protein